MKINLKDEYKDKLIYIPFENRDILGKFIDVRLYPYLYKKYPTFFDIIEIKKTKKQDDISINDTKSIRGLDTEGKGN